MAMDKSKVRILVLDDEAFTIKLHCHMLIGLGFTQVIACDNGRAALDWVRVSDTSPSLILLDLNMPDMDGVEFARKLVQHEFSGSLILVSGEDERLLQAVEKLVRSHRISVLGHLCKPIRSQQLLSLLDQWRPISNFASNATRKIYSPEEIRAAIANDELVNYYQPKVALTTGAVVGVETLVRWQHPVDGLIYPEQFISVAEEHKLIDELTRTVLRNTLVQAKAWSQAGLELRVAMNVSMDNLSSVDFADIVATETADAGVMPQTLVLEVTESRLMLDQRAPLEVLARLRLKRFHLSIDDFGTGHSSLAQLRDYPFDELKVDQGFVHGCWRDPTLRAIANSSLGLARQLAMETVAEGVEDRDDWDYLRRTKCNVAQGYFIARPMPASELPDWIESWHERMHALLEEPS